MGFHLQLCRRRSSSDPGTWSLSPCTHPGLSNCLQTGEGGKWGSKVGENTPVSKLRATQEGCACHKPVRGEAVQAQGKQSYRIPPSSVGRGCPVLHAGQRRVQVYRSRQP